jgi:hypothetical protein
MLIIRRVSRGIGHNVLGLCEGGEFSKNELSIEANDWVAQLYCQLKMRTRAKEQ